MRSPPATRVRAARPLRVRVPPLPLQEVTRPDEEPVPKTGRGASPCGCESHRFRHAAMVQVAKTPGPQPGGRGSTPRRGTPCQVVEGQDVRLLPGRRGFHALPGSAAPGGRGSRRAAANRDTGVRVPPGRPCRSDTDPSSRGRRSTARISGRHLEDAGWIAPDGARLPPTTPTNRGEVRHTLRQVLNYTGT